MPNKPPLPGLGQRIEDTKFSTLVQLLSYSKQAGQPDFRSIVGWWAQEFLEGSIYLLTSPLTTKPGLPAFRLLAAAGGSFLLQWHSKWHWAWRATSTADDSLAQGTCANAWVGDRWALADAGRDVMESDYASEGSCFAGWRRANLAAVKKPHTAKHAICSNARIGDWYTASVNRPAKPPMRPMVASQFGSTLLLHASHPNSS